MASLKFLAITLIIIVVGVTAGAILFGTGFSVPVSSSNKLETTAVQTSLVLQTVNLTQSYTTIVPETTFTTVTLTTTFTNYSDTTRTFNSTEVTTDISNSTNSFTTFVTSSAITSATIVIISVQTDVIVQHRR
jgi:hypothetical protein